MIIDLRSVPYGIRHFEYSLDENWWQTQEESGQIQGLDTPLRVRIKLYRAGDKYVLEGLLSGGLQVLCDRCLEYYHLDLKFEFKVYLALPASDREDSEIELSENDMELEFIRGEEVDVDDVIREQIYLSLPMKLLCKEGCLGLCSVCGSNNNLVKCRCLKEQGHPGFQKLKNLKLKGSTVK